MKGQEGNLPGFTPLCMWFLVHKYSEVTQLSLLAGAQGTTWDIRDQTWVKLLPYSAVASVLMVSFLFHLGGL